MFEICLYKHEMQLLCTHKQFTPKPNTFLHDVEFNDALVVECDCFGSWGPRPSKKMLDDNMVVYQDNRKLCQDHVPMLIQYLSDSMIAVFNINNGIKSPIVGIEIVIQLKH